jgi:hypothetical protein
VFGLHSLTSVLVKSITQLTKDEKNEEGRARLVLQTVSNNFDHNFSTLGNLMIDVEVKIDLTNLEEPIDSVKIKAIEPYMMRDSNGEIYLNVDSKGQIFNWFGLTEVIFKRPFTENHIAKFKCVFPNAGVFNLNSLVMADSATNKEIKFVGQCEQFLVKVSDSLI